MDNHENMDMGADMNMYIEDHEADPPTTADTSAKENQLVSFHTSIRFICMVCDLTVSTSWCG